MDFIQCSALSEFEKLEVFELWNNEYPEKLAHNSITDFENYLNQLEEQNHLLLINSEGKIKGWYFDFMRDNEKWFAIILDSKLQGEGLGTSILELAKQRESELNGWVIDHNHDKKKNSEFYKSPLKFYTKNGFKILSDSIFESRGISAVKIRWVNNSNQNNP